MVRKVLESARCLEHQQSISVDRKRKAVGVRDLHGEEQLCRQETFVAGG